MEQIPIIVNGMEKYANGITKDTTVDDIKFAMLSHTDTKFTPDMLDDYAIFEKWQNNERLLDGKIKMYKIVRNYKMLPGDQLSQVRFIIKKRIQIKQSSHVQPKNNTTFKGYKFCSLSPNVQKTWNEEKIQRKSSYVKKQLKQIYKQTEDVSFVSIPSSAWSSDNDETDTEQRYSTKKRYATIKQLNRMRNSSIKKTESYINTNIKEKLNRIKELKSELNIIQTEMKAQNDNGLNLIKEELNQIDDMISLKTKLIQSLEFELNQIEQQEIIQMNKKTLVCTNSASSITSVDSGVHSDDEFYSTTQLVTLV